MLSKGNTMYNTTFNNALAFHKQNHADITVLYNQETHANSETLARYTLLDVDDSGRVTDIMKNHPHPKGCSVSMDTYIMDRSFLINTIENCIAHGEHDWVMDVMVKNVNRLKIYGYQFEGYVGRVDTIDSYYQNNMNFLKPEVRRELFSDAAKVYTKVKDQVPTHYGDHAKVVDSIVADGCMIDGSVENSVIFRGVHIGKGATVKNSIVMQNSVIQENCFVENVVLDKGGDAPCRENRHGPAELPLCHRKGKYYIKFFEIAPSGAVSASIRLSLGFPVLPSLCQIRK